jgi:hypothetical protein
MLLNPSWDYVKTQETAGTVEDTGRHDGAVNMVYTGDHTWRHAASLDQTGIDLYSEVKAACSPTEFEEAS